MELDSQPDDLDTDTTVLRGEIDGYRVYTRAKPEGVMPNTRFGVSKPDDGTNKTEEESWEPERHRQSCWTMKRAFDQIADREEKAKRPRPSRRAKYLISSHETRRSYRRQAKPS